MSLSGSVVPNLSLAFDRSCSQTALMDLPRAMLRNRSTSAALSAPASRRMSYNQMSRS